ncbi:trypsin-like peptidase domain-containing protein [Dyella sp.]|uniref:trypsin-like peptidase domain-containing protein n=1 Tax=Dyella sp. TaxID=1869338 RepID=UPI003F7FEADD
MIHALSRATTYLTTYFINPVNGEHIARSRATGFFVRAKNALLLVTNWHVVTGLNPADPSVLAAGSMPPPHYLKVTVANRKGGLSELTLPLYKKSMEPIWDEHQDGCKVDVVVYVLPLYLEDHFHFVDILSAEGGEVIDENVGNDVFILGYPFGRDEMEAAFGDDAPYYLPIWKRGTIASEPALRLKERVLLIDSLSRPGMSGAPIVAARDSRVMRATSRENSEVFARIKAGDRNAFKDIDMTAVKDDYVRNFQFLGVYSGVIGNSRMTELALGLCWHADVIQQLFDNHRIGVMPFYAPEKSEYYDAFLDRLPAPGGLIHRDMGGKVSEHTTFANNRWSL